METRGKEEDTTDGQFADADEEDDVIQTGNDATNNATDTQQHSENEIMGVGNDVENKKRSRENEGDDDVDDEDDDTENEELLLFYLPSVQCTCSSWKMKHVSGDLFITSQRVFFLAEKQDDDDVAIDGRCIALHAIDSLPGENETNILHHVYCQLAEVGDEGDMGYATSIKSMIVPEQVAEENVLHGEGEQQGVDEGESFEENGTIEVYFKPTISKEAESNGKEASQCNKCQTIFDALTKLASLNPAGDSDDTGGGGGLFSMLSMMAGIGGFGGEGMVVAGHDNESGDDDMVVRFGGSNNLVENDDDSSEGAPEEERREMLQRLDDMLVVPPEYEIPSDDDNGQFDDAEEDGDDIL